ncbi:MAG: hypothetical protein DWI58_01770 [Chloroflexi bacterium]|nr:MAG: hypothetical protein DWI58_01770 [Chloroflexota bacterium]
MTLRVLVFLLCTTGLIWALQGSGLLPGSLMTGDRTWLGVGAVTALARLFLLYRSFHAGQTRHRPQANIRPAPLRSTMTTSCVISATP